FAFFFSSRRRHTRFSRDWSSDVCSSDLVSATTVHTNATATGSDTSMRGRYSPAVQTLASQHGISLEHVQGTGLGGRITRKDVLRSEERRVGKESRWRW